MVRNPDIDLVADRIQQLRVDYERFFNGALLIPPTELRDTIQRMVRQLRQRPMPAFADRFRLTQLEARFNTYCELFNRRQREREEGRGRTGAPAPAAAAAFDPARGVVVGDRLSAPAAEALYAGLCRGGEAPQFDLESFRQYLSRQSAEIRSKTGCLQVRFRLVEEGGRTKLKARPIRASTDPENGGEPS